MKTDLHVGGPNPTEAFAVSIAKASWIRKN
jgi:hypothetical protein